VATVSGDLGAVIIAFVILLASIVMTFVAYYVLMDCLLTLLVPVVQN
jgi:hypothetical protein